MQYFVGGILLLFVYAVLLTPFLFLFNGETYVDMSVLSMETDLPLDFLDSLGKGSWDISTYHFELHPKVPLTLKAVVILNEKESRTLEHFEPNYNVIGLWGEPLSDFVILLEEPSDDSQNYVKLYSKTRFSAHDILESRYWREEKENTTTHFYEDDLNVLFVFEEGTANVQYKFFDREIIRSPPFRVIAR